MTESAQYLEEHLPTDVVLIAGGGPVGLLLATVLSHFGVHSILLERNETTTRWPKMDLTNARSMEIFRRLGLSQGLRAKGVPPHISHNVLISTGLSTKAPVTKWLLPSVDEFRANIENTNDGSQPWEPWQRISQVHFEAWLKVLCEKDPMIDARFGWRVQDVTSQDEQTITTATCIRTNTTTSFVSKYLVGCDGASSVVRRALNLPLDGGPT
jgi:FAD-dependent monooxygenase